MFNLSGLLTSRGHDVVPFSVRYSRNVASQWSDYFVSPIAGDDDVYFRDHGTTPRTVLKGLERSFYSREVYAAVKALAADCRPDAALVLHYLRKLSPSLLAGLSDAGVPIVVRLSDFAMVCPGAHLLRDGELCEDCVGGHGWPSVAYGCVQGSRAVSAVNYCAMRWAHRRGLFDLVRAFVAPSTAMRQRMVAGGIPASRIHVVPTPVEALPMLPPLSARRTIAYVGRITHIKGVSVLIEAFRKLRASGGFDDVELRIAGDFQQGDAETLLDDAGARSTPGIQLLGELDAGQVRALLASSWLSVVPSLCLDNLPNSLLESLACGTPVVVSDIETLVEALDGTEAGMVSSRGDAEGLARALADVLGDTHRLTRMRREALQLARRRYDPEIHCDSMLALMQ
jgi:glycosyltransferase involved in cell wall biosynthesis